MKTMILGYRSALLLLIVLALFSAGAQADSQARTDQIWQMLEDSDWVMDGDSNAETIVYTFTDPNCPYCDRFREVADPWIEAGNVQLRHIMVGILRQDSAPLAATVIGSEDAASALSQLQEGKLGVNREIAAGARKRVMENNNLMSQIGARATPTSLYLDETGQIGVAQGIPNPGAMERMMGGPEPQ